jgi:hypothetical protein
MRNRNEATSVAALLATLLALGAGCHLDALLGPPGGGGGGGGGGGLASLEQLRSDTTTPIPSGGSTPEPSIVVGAVVRDTGRATLRLEVEMQPVGTDFLGQPTATSNPTSSGSPAYVLVSGLQNNTGYHWQARAEGATAWQPYGGTAANVADFRVVLPVAATRLVFTRQPTTTTAGATMAPAVEVTLVDAQGSTITTFTGNVHLDIAPNANPSGGVLAGTVDVNAVAGVATFSNLSITKAGSGYRLQATADGLTAVTSGSFGINAGIAHHPKFLVQPSNTTPNTPIKPAVQVAVMDVYDNVATSFTGTVYMGIANDGSVTKNATLEPSGTQRAAAAGIATFEDLKINLVGIGYTLVASATAVHAETSAPFDVTP